MMPAELLLITMPLVIGITVVVSNHAIANEKIRNVRRMNKDGQLDCRTAVRLIDTLKSERWQGSSFYMDAEKKMVREYAEKTRINGLLDNHIKKPKETLKEKPLIKWLTK